MAFFFNGRLWISPAVMSLVDDSALANANPAIGNNVCILGTSSGGKPNTALAFGSPTQAQQALISGPLLDAVTRAFAPSNETNGPSTVYAMRVNPAVQSSLTLFDTSGAASVLVQSADYGQYTNQIKLKVEAATTQGLKLTGYYGNSYYVADNTYNAVLSVSYTGVAASANISVTATQVVLFAPAGTVVATIPLSSYATVQQLADFINVQVGFVATVLGGQGGNPALNGLDGTSALDCKTQPATITANILAVVNALNSQMNGLFSASRLPTAFKAPALSPFAYLSGGSDGVTTNTQWQNAFNVLQTVDVQWIAAITPTPSVIAMADAHVQFMSTVGRMERRNISGMDVGTTDTAAIAMAYTLNSDRTSLLHIGFYDFNAAGVLTLYPAYVLAGLVAGMFAAVSPGTALTNKSFTARGLERLLRNPTDTDPLITGGVMCVDSEPEGFKIVQSISTWLTNENYNRVEQSTGAALDYVVRAVRQGLKPYVGQDGNPRLLSRCNTTIASVLAILSKPAPAGPGMLVGDANSPPYKNIVSSISGDVVSCAFQCSPVIPANYIDVTVYATPYSGTQTLAA